MALRVNERHLWILSALHRMRFLTTKQVSALFFNGSRAAANKALRRMLDSGLVRVWLRSLAEDNVYSLAQRGAEHVAKHLDVDGRTQSIAVPRALDGKLDHLLQINRTRIAFALTLPAVGGELTEWRSDWDLCGRGPLVPDALFTVRWNDGSEHTYSLEADHHSRNARRFLGKILRYGAVIHQDLGLYGFRDFVVLVVGDNARWIDQYRTGLRNVQPLPIWFTTVDELEEYGAAAAIWQASAFDGRYDLRILTERRYRKDVSGTANDAVAWS